MKKIISTVLVCVLLLSTMLVLVSCGGGIDNGKYIGTNGVTVEISGDKYIATVSEYGETFTVTYKYEVKNNDQDPDQQVIVLAVESLDYDGSNSAIKNGYSADADSFELPYEKNEDGFVVAGIKYTKK